jgi:hypothetical protein
LLNNLNTQQSLLQGIHDDLYIVDCNDIEAPSIKRYETNLRSIIKQLLEIPKENERARMYIRTKSGTISCLRKARTLLNLMLDECAFLDEGKTTDREKLGDCLEDLTPCLEQALDLWIRK